MRLIVGECSPFSTMSPPHSCIPLCIQGALANATCPGCPMPLMGAAHKRSAVGMSWPIKPSHRLHPTPRHVPCCPPATSAHAISALCWQDAACMERRCRLSAVQAEQALGCVHTWHRRLCYNATGIPSPRLVCHSLQRVASPWPMCCLGAEAHPPPSASE